MHQHPDNVSVYTIKTIFLEISGDCHSTDCSMIILSVAIWSVHDLFFLKMACSSSSFSSSAPFILSNSMRVKTVLGTDSSVIPRQFLHIPKSPFFGSFTRYPFSILGLSLVPRSSGIDGATYLLLLSGCFQSLWWYAVWSWCLSVL